MRGSFWPHPVVNRARFTLLAAALAAVLTFLAPTLGASAAGVPSGERTLGQSTAEPAYNDANGAVIYLNTPDKAPMDANPTAWAPIYIPVYPMSAASSVGVMQCAHSPADNCPDHGPAIANAVESIPTLTAVYGGGVWGHDHLLAPPASGGDFNIAWEPVLVLFTNSAAANTHLTTLAQINAAVDSHNAIKIPLASATFHCEVVSAEVYNDGVPVTPV